MTGNTRYYWHKFKIGGTTFYCYRLETSHREKITESCHLLIFQLQFYKKYYCILWYQLIILIQKIFIYIEYFSIECACSSYLIFKFNNLKLTMFVPFNINMLTYTNENLESYLQSAKIIENLKKIKHQFINKVMKWYRSIVRIFFWIKMLLICACQF